MRLATLCLLIKDATDSTPAQILLGHKKDGMGEGKIAGFGGGVEKDESIPSAAVREMYEESKIIVSPRYIKQVAHVIFYFPTKPEWEHDVHVYVAKHWLGTPEESDEMIPEWFDLDAIPYEQMWADNKHWLPYVLRGEYIEASYTFENDLETIASTEILDVHPLV